MAVTYSSTPLASLISIMSNALVSNAGAGSETVTLVHRLGVSPHRVWGYLRSITTAISLAPVATYSSWNASQATIVIAGGGPSVQTAAVANYDFVSEFCHSLIQ